TPPAVVGVMFLGDHTRPGHGGLAVLGFSLAIACAVALARFGEADEEGLTAAQRRRVGQAEGVPSPHTAGEPQAAPPIRFRPSARPSAPHPSEPRRRRYHSWWAPADILMARGPAASPPRTYHGSLPLEASRLAQTKHLFVTGGVASSLGKGLTA